MDPADPERPPTAEGGASGAEKGKKRDEIANISWSEPSGRTQAETDGLKGGGVELDDGGGGRFGAFGFSSVPLPSAALAR